MHTADQLLLILGFTYNLKQKHCILTTKKVEFAECTNIIGWNLAAIETAESCDGLPGVTHALLVLCRNIQGVECNYNFYPKCFQIQILVFFI